MTEQQKANLIDTLCAAAEEYRTLGLKPLPLQGKTPSGKYMKDWPTKTYDAKAIHKKLIDSETTEPAIGVQSGQCCEMPTIDFEWDTTAQRDRFFQLFGGEQNVPHGPAFKSKRGEHRIFEFEPWMTELNISVLPVPILDAAGNPLPVKDENNKPIPENEPLKIRIGTGSNPGAQSAWPPSPNREWIEGHGVALLNSALLPRVTEFAKSEMLRLKSSAVIEQPTDAPSASDDASIAACVQAMLAKTANMVDGNDGSNRMAVAMKRVVGLNLSDKAGIAAFRLYEKQRPFTRKYTRDKLLKEIRTAETKIERGSDFELSRPIGDEFGEPPTDQETESQPKATKRHYRKCDDIGNGQRFADQHGEDVRYIPAWENFVIWNGSQWKRDEMRQSDRLAKKTARSILQEAKGKSEDIAKAITQWAKASSSRDKLKAMLWAAQSETRIVLDYRRLDSHPWLFNCQNGTVDLQTGKLRDHNRADYLTICSPLAYPTDYTPPQLWLSFLDRIFDRNAAMIGFIQRLMGYSLIGGSPEHVLPIFHGNGANGKSRLVFAWQGILGDDYVFATTKDFLVRTKTERHPTEMASMYGKRLVVTSETDEGARLNESLVKNLTGGNRITARRMRENFWSFDPSHLLLIETNYRPVIVGTEHAIWRRVLLVPFVVTIPEHEKDLQLDQKLQVEWPLILRWAVDGCLEWQRGGLNPPAEVQDASNAYRESSDSFGEFLAERCTIDKCKRVGAGDLYEAYRAWAEARGQQPVSSRRLSERLESRFTKVHTELGKFYLGIALSNSSVSEFDDVARKPELTEQETQELNGLLD